ncbi:MAG TPA: glutamate 5-kinase [Polyangiaceae bacterium]|nr:glutamate 5-kinase [Polyangiaceae bacterium]
MSDGRPGAAEARAALTRARRVVIKIGSRAIATEPEIYDRLAVGVRDAHASKRSVVIVSSGAIALGIKKLGLGARPKDMPLLQAAAAAGQTVLMRHYEEAFTRHELAVAQVLLTHADLADRTRANNARDALAALLDVKVVPIINENDTVAVEEIKFGDNDMLASMVTPLVSADLLILLSDVPGLLDQQGQRVPLVRNVARDARPLATKATSAAGTGGMASKIEAARRGMLAGASVVVADAREAGTLAAILAGEDVGTLFVPYPQRIQARKHWIAFTLRPRGALLLDHGAVTAIVEHGRSILPVGLLGVRGEFGPGDAVTLLAPDGREIGRGLARLGATEAAAIAGKRGDELTSSRGSDGDLVVVHRDDLVLAYDEGDV